jgi:hypothetical protein
LRAGLLSDRTVINLLNDSFVCTSIIIDDVNKRAASGDELARQMAAEWKYPVEMIFLTPSCRLVSKLNSYADFRGAHPDVVAPGDQVPLLDERTHVDAFLRHVARHFAKE